MQVNFVRALAPEKEIDKPVLLTSFAPGICAGFTLAGYKVADGYRLGDEDGELVTELPEEIELNNMIYTLEEVKIEDNGFFNAEYV
jgi:hypothetical protein